MFIIHLGISGFPIGNAPIQRLRLTFKALKFAGLKPLILNKYSLNDTPTKNINIYQGIPYINLSYNRLRPKSFINRNLNKISGIIFELSFLIRKRKKIHIAIYYDPSYFKLLYYRILSSLLGFKIVIQYVELRSSIPARKNLNHKLNDYLFDNYCFSLCDGIIVISEFLQNHTISRAGSLPLIKIPVICDFSEFTHTNLHKNNIDERNYMLYCGTIEYLCIIEFVLQVFEKVKISSIYKEGLILVVSGNNLTSFHKLKNLISKSNFSDSIVLRQNILYADLVQLYKQADLLLIPLRNTLQDIARFPHKVGEYSASGRPILSTNIGELEYYFKDGDSAILSDEFSIDAYCSKLQQFIGSKEILKSIGLKGYEIGFKNFNYQELSYSLKNFILNI